jgi:hypothetical protein
MNFTLFLIFAATMVNAVYGDTPVDLGTAADFAILAKAGITNVPTSIIKGDIGVSPIAAGSMTGFGLTLPIDGFSTSVEVTGQVFAPEYAPKTGVKLTTAVNDMVTAYNNAAAATAENTYNAAATSENTYLNLGGGEIGRLTLTPGIYTFDIDVKISLGHLTFSGDENSVFIIKTTKSLMQAAGKHVILKNNNGVVNADDGPQAKNIFWVVAQSAEVGAGAHMEGTILAKTTVTFITGSSLNGRILAQTLVALQMATITHPDYIVAPKRRGLRGSAGSIISS